VDLNTISREALYDLVWAEPVSVISLRLGISDVWLKKCCMKAGVSVPDRGYWAKVRAGRAVVRQALPPRAPGTPTEVTISSGLNRSRWPSDPETELAAPPPVEPVFAEPIEAVTERIDKSLGKVRFLRDLTSPHNLIRHALEEDVLRRLKPSDAPHRLRYSEPLFDAPFEQRRLRILNSLFLAVTHAGHRPWMNDPQARNVGVTVGSQQISFALDHLKAKSERNGRAQAPREAHEVLRLEIPATDESWADTADARIEDRLRDITLRLIVAGEIRYRANAHSAYERACRARAAMERKISEQRAEAARIAHEKAIKAEAEQRNVLLRMAADHRAAKDIRAFVDAAVETLGGSDPAKAKTVNAWATWALGVADRTDPLGRLHIAEDGTAAVGGFERPRSEVAADS
jgi:hypothetical protein